MGTLDWSVSVLGFGGMRFPVKESWDNIDYEKASEMIHYAIENGVNYFDTAWLYHSGSSEKLFGKVLSDGYREKVKLVTKAPVWLIKTKEDFHSYLKKQLDKLNTDYLDIYLLHGLNYQKWENALKQGLMDEMLKLKDKGIIRHIGFSFHDSYESFIKIIDAFPWDVTQIQYNYLDTDYQATLKGLDYACKKNIAVVIMEPLLGGKLVQTNKEIETVLQNAPVKRSLADWALQYIWNHPGVSTVLSGMSTLEQVKENIEYANNAIAKGLTEDELNTINELKTAYKKKIKIPCTSCQYCMPCPHGVNIPENFALMNHAYWEGKIYPFLQKWYDELDSTDISTDWHGKGKASLCIECGECLDKCPQNIDIPGELAEITAKFES